MTSNQPLSPLFDSTVVHAGQRLGRTTPFELSQQDYDIGKWHFLSSHLHVLAAHVTFKYDPSKKSIFLMDSLKLESMDHPSRQRDPFTTARSYSIISSSRSHIICFVVSIRFGAESSDLPRTMAKVSCCRGVPSALERLSLTSLYVSCIAPSLLTVRTPNSPGPLHRCSSTPSPRLRLQIEKLLFWFLHPS